MRISTEFLIVLLLLFTSPVTLAADADFNSKLLEGQAGENWYGLYFSGGKVGYMRIATSLDAPGLVNTEEEVAFRLKIMGRTQELSTLSKRTYNRTSGTLERMSFSMKSEAGQTQMEIVKDDALWRQTSIVGGAKSEKMLDYEPENIYDLLANEAAIAAGRLDAEQEIVSYVYDPSVSMRLTSVNRVTAREKRLYGGVPVDVVRFEGELKEAHLPQTSWYDLNGRLLEMKVAGFLTALLESEELVRSGEYLADFMAATVIKTPQKIKNQKSAPGLQIVFEGISSEELKISSLRQQWEILPDGTARLTVKREQPGSHAWKPAEAPLSAEFLSPDERIQSSDARIVELARKITQGSATVEEAAKKLLHWVYEEVEKKYTPSFSNALDVLESMEGDCGEHAVLFVALARAAGIQAREVTGIVYAQDIGGFGFHAWAEVLAGDTWLSVDPAWGQMPVDVTHLAFAQGGAAAQMKIAALIGSLKIIEIKTE